MRKMKWNPQTEAKVKLIINSSRDRAECLRLLQHEGFKLDESQRIIQRFYKPPKYRAQALEQKQVNKVVPKNDSSPSLKEQRQDVMTFAQQVREMAIYKKILKRVLWS